MSAPATTRERRTGLRLAAFVTALLVAVLGLSAPSTAQAVWGDPPTGSATVRGTIAFAAGTPAAPTASLLRRIDYNEPDATRSGLYLTLSVDQPGTVEGWDYGQGDTNVTVDASSGAWSISGVGNGRFRLNIGIVLPNNGYVEVLNRIIAVSGSEVSLGTATVDRDGRLSPVIVACEGLLRATRVIAQNRATGQEYEVEPAQSGWIGPHDRCADASYGNYRLLGAPAGDYLLAFEQNGVREYYSGSEIGTTSIEEAATVTLKSWEGTSATFMYGLAKPVSTAAPTTAATARVGATLRARTSGFVSGAKLSYQWQRNGADIGGATKSSYRAKPADRGKKLTVTVSGAKAGYWPVARTSKATKSVANGKLQTGKPKVRGTKKVGRTLKATRSGWTAGTRLSYRWYRSGKAIGGATKSSYRLKSADAGKRIRVKVTGKKAGYATASRSSSSTARITR
ncbi:hypothetical protein J4H92_09595 [Leucobacter weissii]|uniref:Carboxypeptidase regulatory-like domain-containing protein n=1 Tax=Leucobacter weissii TaxID=1983706 RepID=A0A939MK27_9MICO|nr:hypothetical protein [Leucobacter weissii]MBO1902198.1 hypothetical protein [Leucobacter weissii]